MKDLSKIVSEIYNESIDNLIVSINDKDHDSAVTILYRMDTLICEQCMQCITKDKELFCDMFPNSKKGEYMRIIVHERYKKNIVNFVYNVEK